MLRCAANERNVTNCDVTHLSESEESLYTMPTFVLHVKCTLEGVAKLEADANTTWILTVESQDGSESREGVYISRNEEILLDGSKGIAHFVVKFKGANKQVSH
jgi:Eukaryotic protein of unknown function (DUF866)